MHPQLRNALEVIAFIVIVSLICLEIPVQAHEVDCASRSNIGLARCERHQKMPAQCGPLKSEAHFACDREFLISHPHALRWQCGEGQPDGRALIVMSCMTNSTRL